MKRTVAILLSLMLCLGALTACAGKEKTDAQAPAPAETVSAEPVQEEQTVDAPEEQTSEEPEEQAVEEPEEQPGETYIWDGATIELTDLTFDTGDWESQLSAPDGKWADVVLTITDGKIPVGNLRDRLEDGGVKLGDYKPVTFIAQGIEIEGTSAVAVGTLHMFFDVDNDYVLDKANVTVVSDAA